MFRKNDDKKKTYGSFDSWIKTAQDSFNEIKAEIEKEIEEEKKKQTYESGKKPTVFRKFSNNKDVKELFPRSSKQGTLMDKKSHEGKVNSRGSIAGKTMMGSEGDPINPDLRRRLAEKKAKERKIAREKRQATASEGYKRKSVAVAEKKERIDHFKQSLKNKENFRKAILASEILGPPLSKRHNR